MVNIALQNKSDKKEHPGDESRGCFCQTSLFGEPDLIFTFLELNCRRKRGLHDGDYHDQLDPHWSRSSDEDRPAVLRKPQEVLVEVLPDEFGRFLHHLKLQAVLRLALLVYFLHFATLIDRVVGLHFEVNYHVVPFS